MLYMERGVGTVRLGGFGLGIRCLANGTGADTSTTKPKSDALPSYEITELIVDRI